MIFVNIEDDIRKILMQLLYCIRDGDSKTYKELVSKELTCFEPETKGNPVDGLEFHLFLIDNLKSAEKYHLELIRPVIRVYGDTAYVAYTLLQTYIVDGKPEISSVNETRIFRKEPCWKMIHFHRG